MSKYRSRSKESGAFFRSFKTLMSIVILTAFVLGISYFVKQVSSTDIGTVLSFADPIMSKAGISSKQVGVVAGEFAKRVNETKIDSTSQNDTKPVNEATKTPDTPKKELAFQVCILSDSHDENDMLKKALIICKDKGVKTAFDLGDVTDHGEVANLSAAKDVLDASGLKYYVLPGDHDLYATVGPENFIKVFGEPNETVTIEDKKFVLFDNSPNFTPVSSEDMAWLKNQLLGADFLLLSQPLYHPSGDVVMGVSITGEKDQAVYDSAQEMLKYVRNSPVLAVVAGDRHEISLDKDPVKPALQHYAAGALTTSRNLDLQSEFAIMNVYKDGSFDFDKVVLE